MPIIATRHCDIPAEVAHGQSGLLADEKDINSLAKHIQTFYEMDRESYLRFSQQARLQVEQHFDIRQNAQLLRTHYEHLLC